MTDDNERSYGSTYADMRGRISLSLENLCDCASDGIDKKQLSRARDRFESACRKIEADYKISADTGIDNVPICDLDVPYIVSAYRMMLNLKTRIDAMDFLTNDNNLARLLKDESHFIDVEYLNPITDALFSADELPIVEETTEASENDSRNQE